MNVRGWPVMAAKCSTCPFREGSAFSELRASVESRLLQASQICHHPALSGKRETHLCRGARDQQQQLLYRLGYLDEPTDEAWTRAELEARERKEGRHAHHA